MQYLRTISVRYKSFTSCGIVLEVDCVAVGNGVCWNARQFDNVFIGTEFDADCALVDLVGVSRLRCDCVPE